MPDRIAKTCQSGDGSSLREKVARALEELVSKDFTTYEEAADAAIAVCMEEAARVAEDFDGRPCKPIGIWPGRERQAYDSGQVDASRSVASAIRALIPTSEAE